MKNNTDKAVSLVSEAIRLCNDFSLNVARSYLYGALNEINKIDKKRKIRKRNQIQAEQQILQNKNLEEIRRKQIQDETLKKELESS